MQQFVEEGFLRWDSLGEFMALAESLDHLGRTYKNAKAQVLAKTLDQATAKFLDENKSPARKVGGLDNRGSHYYLAMYWAQAVAAQTETPRWPKFANAAMEFGERETRILDELKAAQGKPVDLGGYYQLDEAKAVAAMRPSATLNQILASIG